MYVLEIDDLHAGYGAQSVLRGVRMQIGLGQWFCLLGPNGAGKSTLIHCIAGRLRPVSGDIRIDGFSVFTTPAAAKRGLGYACAPDQLPGLLTGRQCLEVYAIARDLQSIDADVMGLADELLFTPFIDGCVDTYSLGTRQKLCALLALLGNPCLIVFDEAFNGLDPRSALALKYHLRKRLVENRCSVLLATHSLDMVKRHADTAALLLDGAVARQWTAHEIRQLEASGEDGFERALAAASGNLF